MASGERTCIACSVPPHFFEHLSPVKKITEDYNVIFWPEFMENFESLCSKIEVLLVYPPGMPRIADETLKLMPNLKVS